MLKGENIIKVACTKLGKKTIQFYTTSPTYQEGCRLTGQWASKLEQRWTRENKSRKCVDNIILAYIQMQSLPHRTVVVCSSPRSDRDAFQSVRACAACPFVPKLRPYLPTDFQRWARLDHSGYAIVHPGRWRDQELFVLNCVLSRLLVFSPLTNQQQRC